VAKHDGLTVAPVLVEDPQRRLCHTESTGRQRRSNFRTEQHSRSMMVGDVARSLHGSGAESSAQSYHLIEMHLGITESGLAPVCGRNRSKPQG
jgi:hypothetical protein